MAKSKKQRNAEYWEKNKEKISAKRKLQYHGDTREKRLASSKKWLKENRDRWNAYQREYRRKQRDKLKLDKSNQD